MLACLNLTLTLGPVFCDVFSGGTNVTVELTSHCLIRSRWTGLTSGEIPVGPRKTRHYKI